MKQNNDKVKKKTWITKSNVWIDEYSKKMEPYMKMSIFVTLLASIVTPSLIYLCNTYKSILKNEYVYLGILMLLIPILLEVLLSLGIKQKLFLGLVFISLYLILMIILVWGNHNPWLIAIAVAFLGYLISYILIKGIIIFIKELKSLFTETKSAIALLGQAMIPLFGTIIPIAVAIAIKYLLNN